MVSGRADHSARVLTWPLGEALRMARIMNVAEQPFSKGDFRRRGGREEE